MRPVGTLTVQPALPPELEPLRTLAYNVRWSWNAATRELFRRLDADLWEDCGHNPVEMLGRVAQDRLNAALADDGFTSHLAGVSRALEQYLASQTTWYDRNHARAEGGGRSAEGRVRVAYFSAEFGITECLPIFAGGLGALAGDHLKSASDLGVPLVGVGLLYQQGYFRQYLNDAGWQGESYIDNDFHRLPLRRLERPDGTPLRVTLALPGRELQLQVWQVEVGRIALLLLDSNLPENAPADRDITDQLYGGDNELRLQQELVLGIGGMRALAAAGYEPEVFHMNEGHSAFLGLERIRQLRAKHGLSFAEAHELARAGLIFTTHTPVDAGHDRFPPDMVRHYFASYAGELGITVDALLALGREAHAPAEAAFNMSMLALRVAARANGVSRLHAHVSRHMWRSLWPGLPLGEIPIAAVNNGVHFRSWISRELDQLFDRYLGPRWREEPADRDVWQRALRIPAEEVWRTHELRRERLIAFARRRLRQQRLRRHALPAELAAASEALDPEALTIGFARRFAPYKRATLLMRDRARLAALLTRSDTRVQFIFAGKAHPRDQLGKELIRQLIELSREEPFRGRVVFLEDYDLSVARYMVQGCDIWLNTPRRPLEASGTSGMKAAANGALNVSTLDGWWADAWEQLGEDELTPGWAIGNGEEYQDLEEQDAVESLALYELLERRVIPEFCQRTAGGLPRQWVQRMQHAWAELCPYFNTHRMVREYTEEFYLPALAQGERLRAEGCAPARQLASWRAQLSKGWPGTRVQSVENVSGDRLHTGDTVRIRARVQLDGLHVDDVTVQLCIGHIDAAGELVGCVCTGMASISAEGSVHCFEGSAPVHDSGSMGYTVRVLPRHPELVPGVLEGLVTWAS